MTHPCLVVLTARGPHRILEEGGSQAWRLNPDNAKRFKFCVCVQNQKNGNWGGASQPDHEAFLVGRIKDVVRSNERADRYLVLFSHYAKIKRQDAWPGNRNPVRYSNLLEFGIDNPDELAWVAVPRQRIETKPGDAEDEEVGTGPLTISDAKAGLALGLGVMEESIEIIIRA